MVSIEAPNSAWAIATGKIFAADNIKNDFAPVSVFLKVSLSTSLRPKIVYYEYVYMMNLMIPIRCYSR